MAQFYYGPEPGVKASHSRRDMMEKVADRTGITFNDYERSHGKMKESTLRSLLEYLGLDPADDLEAKCRQLADRTGIPVERYQGNLNNFDRDAWWQILQHIQEGDQA